MGVVPVTIDPFKRALIITAIAFNPNKGSSIMVHGLTPTATDTVKRVLRAEPYVGVHIMNFSDQEYQGMTTLTIHLQNRGRFQQLPSFNLLLGECLGMYLDVDSFSETWKTHVKRLMSMNT